MAETPPNSSNTAQSAPVAVPNRSSVQFNHQINTILNQDNYLLWKSQILATLRGNGLVSFVDNTVAIPDPTIAGPSGASSPNPAYEQWYQQDQLILAWIFSSISPPILSQVVNCATTRELWNRILQMNTSQSIAKALELKLQLQTSKKGGATCTQYLQHMQNIAERLRSIGEPISDRELLLFILQGLGPDYDNFVTAIATRSTPPSMDDFQSLLLAHEARSIANLRSLNPTVHYTHTSGVVTGTGITDPAMVLYSASKPRPAFNSTSWNVATPPTTYHQNSSFNRGKASRGRGRGRQGSNPDKHTQCQICWKWGHPAWRCYHRFDAVYTGEQGSQAVVHQTPLATPSSSAPQALLAQPTVTPSSSWFLDSGATTHVTSDINNLSNAQVYSGFDEVHIGNGAGLKISHTGNATLSTYGSPLKLTNMLCVPEITKNLLSIAQLTRDNLVFVEFSSTSCFIKDRVTNQILLSGSLSNGLYEIEEPQKYHHVFQAQLTSPEIWHGRLAHCSSSVLAVLRKNKLIDVANFNSLICSACCSSKAHKLPFQNSANKAVTPLPPGIQI